jgi:hypothetical protein
MRTSAAELEHCHPGRKQSPQRCAEGGTNHRVQYPQERRGRRTMAHVLPVVVRSHTRLPTFARLVLGLPVVTPRSPGTYCPFWAAARGSRVTTRAKSRSRIPSTPASSVAWYSSTALTLCSAFGAPFRRRGDDGGRSCTVSDVTREPCRASWSTSGSRSMIDAISEEDAPTESSEKEKGKAGARAPQGPAGLPPSRIFSLAPPPPAADNASERVIGLRAGQCAERRYSKEVVAGQSECSLGCSPASDWSRCVGC